MSMPRRLFPLSTPVPSNRLVPLAGILAALLLSANAYAAVFGHSRIVSAPGKPLAIDVPVSRLSDQDLASIKLAPAPAAAWTQAGLTPPVDLSSMQLRLAAGITPDKRIIQVRSTQPFGGSVVDVLLDIGTASGQQRYQVSLLTQAAAPLVATVATPSASQARAGTGEGQGGDDIAVKRGDTLFAIARKNAVADVSVYQMMVALHQANPQAFIQSNLNLIKAGATLSVPDSAALTAISDAQARRIFHQHALAFAAYQQGSASSASVDDSNTDGVQAGTVGSISPSSTSASSSVPIEATPGDQLRLSANNGVSGAGAPAKQTIAADGSAVISPANGGVLADDRLATSKNIDDTGKRVSQLEENVKNLNRALQSQGEAAKDLVLEGAKGISQSLSDMADAVTEATEGSSRTAPAVAGDAASGDGAGSATSGDAAFGSPATGSDANRANNITDPVSQKADSTVSWLQEHLLAVITGVLALIVLLIAWALRRANINRNQAAAVSPAMVKQKLDEINLDLNQPATDTPTNSKP